MLTLPTRFMSSLKRPPWTCPLLRKKVRQFSSSTSRRKISCQEVRIPVPWGHIAGKWWGPTDRRPLLALHGWQDNCGTFNRLIPLLNNELGVLAIDFPGHGHSSHLQKGLYYHFSNYLLTVEYIVQFFQWSRISLMGHSMGALISFAYGLAHNKSVDFVICLDAFKPMVIQNNRLRIPKLMEEFAKYEKMQIDSTREPPSFSLDELKQGLCNAYNGSIELDHSFHLVERNVAPSKIHPGKYYISSDPRMKLGEMVNWPQDDVVESAKHATFPVCIIKATKSSYYEKKENFYEVLDVVKKHSVDCRYHRLEGTHHLHLNTPEAVAEVVKDFISNHDRVADRAIGGIKDEVRAQISV